MQWCASGRNHLCISKPRLPGALFSLILNNIPPQSGITYQWQSSTNGINFNNIAGAIQQQLLTSELQPTFYRCVVKCTASGLSSFSQPLLVTLIQPVIQYPNATVQLNNGESTSPDNTGYVTFETTCCQGSVTYSDVTVTTCCKNVITRTWTIIDCFGEGTQYIQTITVLLDVTAPVITCATLPPGICNTAASPDNTTVTVSDECPVELTVTSSDAAGSRPCEVVTTFTWTATDLCGHSSSCTQTYSRIMDAVPPVIICPAPAALPCNTTPSPDPRSITATDNCGTPEIVLMGSSSSTTGCLVTYVFSWRAIDACGNFSDCNQVFTSIHDLVPPVITCPGETTLDCNTIPNPSVSLITATDNCGTPTITLNSTDAITVDCYTTYIFEWKATDDCGNESTCLQIINTIADLLPPAIACPSPETLACNTIPVPDPSQVLAFDNCGTANVFLIGSNSSTVNCLTTYTFYWRAYDECNNFADCEQVFYSVTDHEPPVIVCPPTDTICNAVPTPSASLISATDNCGPADITYVGTTTSTAGCITTYNFTWKATDQCGNFSTCVQVIRVINDLLPPVITGCPNSMSVPTELGLCGAHVNWVPPVATDNCGLLSFTNTFVPNGFFPVGNTTVTYTATDYCGHVTICEFVITVYDWEPPWNMNCPGVIIQDNDPGLCTAVVTWNVTATDNCAVADITSVPPSGSTFPVGVTPVTVTATDINGNTWTCSFNVHVNDNEKPVFLNCPGNIVVNNTFRLCSANVIWPPIHVTDNCGIATVTIDPPLLAFPVGDTRVTYTATDIHGNVQECSFIVRVVDNEPPVINNCPANIRVDNDPTLCKAKVTWLEPTAADNCGILSFTSDHHSGDDFPVGTTPVTYTAEDIHGNITTCIFNVRVDDNEDPFILSHDTVTCDSVINFNFIIGDNCGIDSYSYTPPSGTVFHPGTTTLVYAEAWDIHGNFTYRYFNVTVEVPPSKIDTVIASSAEICLGDSVTLTAYFDTLGSYGVIKFYKGSCLEADVIDSANDVDNTWSLKVKPSASGIATYYARIEGACDTTQCKPVTISVISCPSNVTLNLKIFIEGFYSGGGLMDNNGSGGCLYVIQSPGASYADVDSVNVGAMEPTYPFSEVDNQTSMLHIDGGMSVIFNSAVIPGNSYFIRIRHRSSLETWSKNPVMFNTITSYDFTTSSSRAYDDGFNLPMKKVDNNPERWAIFNGDINHDGTADALDMTIEELHSNAGDFGYYPSDLNGDGGSDALDMTIIENNSNLGIFETHP